MVHRFCSCNAVLIGLIPAIFFLLTGECLLAKPQAPTSATAGSASDSEMASNQPLTPIADVEGLPRVLLIGDSISIGYTLPTRKLLEGRANVHRIPTNGSSTSFGLANLQKWLGHGKWAVIHFNFGLHDAKLPPEGARHAPPETYEKNLRDLVDRLKATGARVVWATTTPVPKGGNLAPNRKFASIDLYNEIGAKVMREQGVAINDLNQAIKPHLSEVGRSNDVHFSEAGYRILAKYVAESIGKELSQKDSSTSAANSKWKIKEQFHVTPYGHTPNDWYDAIGKRPSRAWIRDGNGCLRFVLKNQTGLILYRGSSYSTNSPVVLDDARAVARFKKTEDDRVSIAVVGRVQDRNNYYMARFCGNDRLELIAVRDGIENPLDYVAPVIETPTRPTGMIALDPYREGRIWSLILIMQGDLMTASLRDERDKEMARVSSRDSSYASGQFGLQCTRFCSVESFEAEGREATEDQPTESDWMRTRRLEQQVEYPVLKPVADVARGNTRWDQLADQYDVVIAGAGTGGTAAAIQASRLGARVLLLEETDWIGGQMSCAGVTTMDEDGGYGKSPIRERGFYREFHESMVAYYQTLDKDPFVTYYSYPDQVEGGYEPKVTRAVLYAFFEERRRRSGVLDVSTRTRVVEVFKQSNRVTGVTVELAGSHGLRRRKLQCKVLIDATEYGDVIPLTGARYRSGNRTSDQLDPAALVQDHTWLAIVREYPEGVPDHLQIKEPPPSYDRIQRRFAGKTDDGALIWGAAFKGVKGDRHWRSYFAWRGSADTESPLTGERSVLRHTQCGFNGGNDYPVTSATLEDLHQRAMDEREGIYKTLGTLYYFQKELGVNWSVAEDEGYATEFNRAKMKSLELRSDLEAIAVHLPQQPYVRESRRIVGVSTLKAADLTRYEHARHIENSVAMGDYFMDLDHGKTAHQIEKDLDSGELPRGGGPFQVPMDVFIPEIVDGFLAAEKNLSQSRLANGATRLQPITMLTGQAVGTLAALAAIEGIEPRQVKAMDVQFELLRAGSTLIQRWHSDVPWGSPIWRATQLLALYRVLDRPGPLTKDAQWLASGHPWGVEQLLTRSEFEASVRRLAMLSSSPMPLITRSSEQAVSLEEVRLALAAMKGTFARRNQIEIRDPMRLTAGEYAMLAADFLSIGSAR